MNDKEVLQVFFEVCPNAIIYAFFYICIDIACNDKYTNYFTIHS